MSEAAGHNRLGRETSPYLLQHKDNPVHWWPWGPEALAEARRTGKPILLSVGYAACHWCHVMAHESFEDEETARLMNDLFVNIKVDREERPDIDAIYMDALHHTGEHGGWPLTMFLDSEARPFWGGTYFPPTSRWGKPSFRHVLTEVSRIYHAEPDKVRHNAEALTALLREDRETSVRVDITDALLRDLTSRLVRAVDPLHGGLQGAPKFPQWSFFWLLWRGAIRYGQAAARAAVETTLTHICQGGIYDHLGGGFARYAVDERWLVPHFEKMLYDNALLIDLMTEVYRETANPLLKLRIAETVSWVEREMIAEGGGFASSLDADSEGEEGRFYVWSKEEVMNLLGPDDGAFFCRVYDVTESGNFEGRNILSRLGSLTPLSETEEARLGTLRTKLLEARSRRVRPGWDDKVLADWNGLMIAALVNAGRTFSRPDWVGLAAHAFAFVHARMALAGRLLHAFRANQAKAPASASDYANMIWGALRLYQATNEPDYLARAVSWTETLNRHYWDDAFGGYSMTADDNADVIVRLRRAHDDATPNANAVMLSNLVQLFLLTGDTRYQERAEAIPQAFAASLQRNQVAHTGLLASAVDLLVPQEVVIVGHPEAADTAGLVNAVRALSLPGAVELVIPPDAPMPASPVLASKRSLDGGATAYVCSGTQCSPPITGPEELREALSKMRRF
ncbi:MAG TPA: thioredoxin domain-containing protein [Hyphomicrobiaceae bacterium]|nr:thioredoxin domain-containing protein [Hyphomicrobiaceae bacterium]